MRAGKRSRTMATTRTTTQPYQPWRLREDRKWRRTAGMATGVGVLLQLDQTAMLRRHCLVAIRKASPQNLDIHTAKVPPHPKQPTVTNIVSILWWPTGEEP